ncbi:MAG: hypothetical protein AAB567_00455 [Patescibacteria group bacterium]
MEGEVRFSYQWKVKTGKIKQANESRPDPQAGERRAAVGAELLTILHQGYMFEA